MSLPFAAQPGTIIVGDPDNMKSQYSQLGRPLSTPQVVDGASLAAAIKQDMQSHGKPLAPVKAAKASSKPVKASSKATKPVKTAPKPARTAHVEPEPDNDELAKKYQPYQPPVEKESREPVRVAFLHDFGQITMNTKNVIGSEGNDAYLVVFEKESDISFKPAPGKSFEMMIHRQGQKASPQVTVFYTGFSFSWPGTENKLLLLAKADKVE